MPKLNLIAALAALLVITGCATGFDAATQQQDPTGNGRYITTGDLQVQNLVIVQDQDRAALLMKIFNDSDQADKLISLAVANRSVLSEVEIPANNVVAFGSSNQPAHQFVNSSKPGMYVPVRLEFERAGIFETTVLVVPPIEQYVGILD